MASLPLVAGGMKEADAKPSKEFQAMPPPRAFVMEPSCSIRSNTLTYSSPGKETRRIRNLLERGERALGISCADGMAFIRTNTSIIAVPSYPERGMKRAGSSISINFKRTSIEGAYRNGFVSWACAVEDCYVLSSKDRRVREIPFQSGNGTIRTYDLPFAVDGARMVHHEGVLFIAPVSERIVAIFLEQWKAFDKPLPQGLHGGFFYKDGMLSFGQRDGRFFGLVAR
jgi:hypothetical protein